MRKLRLVPVLLFILFTGVFLTTNIPSVVAQTPTTACALTPDVLGGQGFTVSGFGFTVSGFGFTVSGFGFTVSGFGFTVSSFGIDPLQVADDIRQNPISNQWLTGLLPEISSGESYNSVKTAILIVDNEDHGDQVEAVFNHLMQVSNADKITVERINIGNMGYRTDHIAAAIQQRIATLKGQGYKHFVINMSFGLVPCDDAGPTFDGKQYPFNFQTALSAIEAGNQPPAPKPVRPQLECVENLGGGQYRARFKYKNENPFAVVIPVGENNKFYPYTPLDRGQPFIFEPGQQRNVFTTVFDGNRIQWFITGPDGVRRNASATKDSTPCSNPLPVPDKGISVVLECVADNGGGSYTARFGYKNDNTVPVSIPVGVDNRFSPEPKDRGQTDIFLPGRRYNVFQVNFDGSNLVWTLKGPDGSTRTATASATSSPCVDDQGYGMMNYVKSLGVPGQYVDDYMDYLYEKVDDDLNDLRLLLRSYLEQSAESDGEFAVFPVASSGNYRPWLGGTPLAPARWKETVAVGATLGNFGDLWQFSHDGNVLAPGAGFPYGNNSSIAGTSFAAPFISAYLAHFATYPNACTFPIVNGQARPPLVAPDTFGNAKVLAGQPSPFTCVPPDGGGEPGEQFVCYADYVVDYVPGTRKDGKPIQKKRRIPEKALGEPEKKNEINFVTLGFDKPGTAKREGVLILGFDNVILNGDGLDVRIWETSLGDQNRPWSEYPEKALIYASQNGVDWVLIGETSDKDQAYDLGSLSSAQFIKIVDTTNPALFNNPDDGFDVDGIEAYTCESPVTEILALPGGSSGRSANTVTASAGEDIVKVDRKGKGERHVRLDASGSYSLNAKIASYEWSLSGVVISTDAQPKVRLPVGTHIITLTVTDKRGSSASDTVTVTIEAGARLELPSSGRNG
jgi:hypothetical protein